MIERPDVVIVEGLNVLQTGPVVDGQPRVFVSDFFDFTVYVDADTDDIRSWYVERFLALRNTAFQDPSSYFHRYARLSDAEAAETAGRIWAEINEPNLRQNILPTRERADLILRKGRDHAVEEVRLLRKLVRGAASLRESSLAVCSSISDRTSLRPPAQPRLRSVVSATDSTISRPPARRPGVSGSSRTSAPRTTATIGLT